MQWEKNIRNVRGGECPPPRPPLNTALAGVPLISEGIHLERFQRGPKMVFGEFLLGQNSIGRASAPPPLYPCT